MNKRRNYPPSRVESGEGAGTARRRLYEYLDKWPSDVVDATGMVQPHMLLSIPDLDPGYRKTLADKAKDQAELIGFWAVWHLAGGFEQLENWGWHRATIYRKIGRFREHFGMHPDEFKFGWIKLDPAVAWTAEIKDMVGIEQVE